MKSWFALVFVLLAGCSALPEQGIPMKRLAGEMTFREMTALPATATAHVVVVPVQSVADARPVAEADFPARTGTAIPFAMKIPAEKVAKGEFLVFAQVIDHGKTWYSNLASPLRISFLAEPGVVMIELRKEP